MKILFIVPGSGDSFYCGNCFRDNLQASALRKAGHEVVVMPLYLPLRHRSFQADTPLFFPATTFYMAQRFFGRRRMPGWLKRVTGSDALLNVASSLAGSTSADGLEGMTLAMITGDNTAFLDMVDQLITWVREREKPDVIHLSSTLLIGIAKEIKRYMDTPIVCSVQDEEVWIDRLDKRYVPEAWRGIEVNARYIDRFVTTSHFYREILRRRLPRLGEIEVIYPGVDREKYLSSDYPEDPVIGFFYRMNGENGLDLLAEAFVKLKVKDTIPNLRLRIGGGYTGKDKPFLRKIRKLLDPYRDFVEIDESYTMEGHASFYRGISVLSVPLRFEEGVGIYLCEAFAAGRPVVEPVTGSFPEIVGQAGVLYERNDSDCLGTALETLLLDKALSERCREHALTLSTSRYDDRVLAERLSAMYQCLMK